MENLVISIKPHELVSPENCAICGKKTKPHKPMDLFIDKTSQPVCRECAEAHAPDMVSLMDYFYKGHYVEPEYEEIEQELAALKELAGKIDLEDLHQLEQDLREMSKRAYVLMKFVKNMV